jgi:prolyl oligopeptidase
LFNKQNCFDDFICAAEHLVAEGVTTSEQLCIQGGSNGGLLVLACALQRPKLYRGVISQVPVADMLRFHRFTIGHAWCTEYGNAEESKADFDNVMKYSPLHNVKEVLSEVRCDCWVGCEAFSVPPAHVVCGVLRTMYCQRL